MKKVLLTFFIICVGLMLQAQTSYFVLTTDSLQKLKSASNNQSVINDINVELEDRKNEEKQIKDLEASVIELEKQNKQEELTNARNTLSTLINKWDRKDQLRSLVVMSFRKNDQTSAEAFKKELLSFYVKPTTVSPPQKTEVPAPSNQPPVASKYESAKSKGVIGVQFADRPITNTSQKQVVITGIYANSGAADAGLKVGDIIFSVDEKLIQSTDQVIAVVNTKYVGDSVSVAIFRNNQFMRFQVAIKAVSQNPKLLPSTSIRESNAVRQNNFASPQAKVSPKQQEPFSVFFYNYVTGLPLGFKYISDGLVYSMGFGENEYADFMMRTNIGGYSDLGLYAECGIISYTIDSKIDDSGDYNFAFDWEIGYAGKIGGLGLLAGVHVVQLNSVQLSVGIGF